MTELRTGLADRPALDLLLRVAAIAVIALAIFVGLPLLAALAG